MDKWNMLFTAEADIPVLKALDGMDIEFAGWQTSRTVLDEDQLIAALRGKQILATSYDKVTRRVIENSKDLKLIVCGRANPVNVDCAAAKEHGIPVAFTPRRNADVTAEFAVGMLLAVARGIARGNRAIMDGHAITDDAPTAPKTDVTWGKVKDIHPYMMYKGPQIRNKTVGIVGFGSVGRRVGDIMRGFGAHLLVYDPFAQPLDLTRPGVRLASFETLLTESDFITCHMSITPETTGLFDYQAFAKMKPTAYFINTARGRAVVEADLIRALRERIIAGAALDVFEYEPLYKGHPFVTGELDNILVTPHIGGASEDAITNGTRMLVDEILRFTSGRPLINSC